MMTDSEIIQLVREVIRQELAPILMGKVVSNESQTRSSVSRFATDSTIPNLRSIMPYGISSRAPKGTPGIIIPVDGNATHLNIVGHFDESRPVAADGESFLYNQFGQMVFLSQGKIQIGSKTADENLVLGQVFKQFASELLQLLAEHTHAGVGYRPTNFQAFLDLKDSPIDDELILSDENFTEKG